MLTPWRAAALDSVNHLLGISREQRLARAMQNETHLAMVGLQVSMAAMARYHRYRVQGLSNIPQQGRCIVAINHSFATYDAFLLAFAICVKHYDPHHKSTKFVGKLVKVLHV